MDTLLQPYFTWTNLLLAALLLWGGYFLLRYVNEKLRGSTLLGKHQRSVTNFIATFLLLFEPITVLMLSMIFLFINPPVHGIILLAIGIGTFGRIRDYLSGRIILTSPLVAEGKRMKTSRYAGTITRIGRMGLYLQTGEGLHFVNYSNLIIEGFSLTTGKEVGGYYLLNIRPVKKEDQEPLRELADRFVTTPYLDRTFKPEISLNERDAQQIDARIAVREELHLRELLELMAEWGYPATVARK